MQPRERGFTLLEVLVAFIIAALALGVMFDAVLGGRLGGAVSFRPVVVFGETDPSARLSVSRDLSRQVTFAMSVDLRTTEGQTYLLDLHGLRRLPPQKMKTLMHFRQPEQKNH